MRARGCVCSLGASGAFGSTLPCLPIVMGSTLCPWVLQVAQHTTGWLIRDVLHELNVHARSFCWYGGESRARRARNNASKVVKTGEPHGPRPLPLPLPFGLVHFGLLFPRSPFSGIGGLAGKGTFAVWASLSVA